jgi:hypothetical protein
MQVLKITLEQVEQIVQISNNGTHKIRPKWSEYYGLYFLPYSLKTEIHEGGFFYVYRDIIAQAEVIEIDMKKAAIPERQGVLSQFWDWLWS